MTTARKYFSSAEYLRHRAAIERDVERALAGWDADGWAIVGQPDRLRVAVFVGRKLAAPHKQHRIGTIPLGRDRLKVAVLATHAGAADAIFTQGSAPLPPGAGTDYLAPGAPVLADQERIGIAGTLRVRGVPHVVTCGHAFPTHEGTLTTLDGTTEVATMTANLRLRAGRLDAAVLAITDDGLELFRAGATASSWCNEIRAPAPGDNQREATFWPTWADGRAPFIEEVSSFSSCVPRALGCGAILLPRCTSPGDSGSSLQLGGAYYGLASRRDGNFSAFTPLGAVKAALERTGASVTVWRP